MVRRQYDYKPTYEGLDECLSDFLANPHWLHMNWCYEAWCDRQAGELTPFREIEGKKNKLIYIKYRFFL